MAGVIGTVRTRDGSNDNNIPAHKVIFIHDVGCGEHLLIKHDEVEHDAHFAHYLDGLLDDLVAWKKRRVDYPALSTTA